MTMLAIHRMTNRFRMPAAAWPERQRLGRLFDAAVFDLLERAVLDAGLDPRGEICIRHVTAFVRLHVRGTDATLAQVMSEALARAIRDAARGEQADVVSYRSRAHALGDLVMSVRRGDFARAWAWSRLDLWPAGARFSEGSRHVMRALTAHPALATGVLAAAARRDRLEWLVKTAPIDSWVELARAVLIEFTGDDRLLDAAIASDAASGERFGEGVEAIVRVVRQSAVVRAFDRSGCRIDSVVARAVALLALAEVEPWRLQDSLLAEAAVDAAARRLSGEQRPPVTNSTRNAAPSAAADDDETGAEGEAADRGDEAVPAGDDLAVTDHGGLLFLIHVLAACGLPLAIAADPALASRDLRWALHQLAMLLTGCEPGDPAAGAFVGLRPTDTTPDRDQRPPTEDETAALSRYAQEIVDRVAAMFAGDDGRDSLAIVKWLCDRRAEIAADPGWIELRFRHAQADTSIRRRGLDLNPDFVPWLAVVVRFAYV
jgi:hypothetical protein